MRKVKAAIPLMPVRDVVVFPHTNITFKVGRDLSKKAIEAVLRTENREMAVVMQKKKAEEVPELDDLNKVGVICSIIQVVEGLGGVCHIFLEGKKRIRLKNTEWDTEGYLKTGTSPFATRNKKSSEVPKLRKILEVSLHDYFDGSKMSADFLQNILDIDDDEKFLDLIAAGFYDMKTGDAQKILETTDLIERYEQVTSFIKLQLELKDLEEAIELNVKEKFERSQKEYFIHEQINALRSELTESKQDLEEEDELSSKIDLLDAPVSVKSKLNEEYRRYVSLPPMSNESAVIRTYIETLLSLPWRVFKGSPIDIGKAEKILENDHFGLSEVKERILEYLAVLKLKGDLKAPIICLVGPPGVGKTSIASSVAKATGRNFVRVSLGGIKDEAEIRGHRRTYISALPGKIIQHIKKSGVSDPLFLLDEIDKLSSDYKGDPASALLEVLDPEQNSSFIDHYVDIEFDLSKVLFIATANDKTMIPPALRDRMEIIDIEGYTWFEKNNIARKFLVPKQKQYNGIEKIGLSFTKDAMNSLIDSYTSESGVRELERKIASICRKIALEKVGGKSIVHNRKTISQKDLVDYLGPAKYSDKTRAGESGIGLVNGLAWTPYGGSVLQMEVIRYPGKGDIKTTGSIGDIMKESVDIAVSYVKSVAGEMFGVGKEEWEKYTIHVHFPEGAVPKDGPSAGMAVAVGVASVMTNSFVRSDMGMTGELTLRGKVLKVGGLQSKIMAAKKAGIKTVYLPQANDQDLIKLPEEIKKGLTIKTVGTAKSVIAESLMVKKFDKNRSISRENLYQ